MPKKVRWGILGASRIGRKVIPSIAAAPNCEVVAVASRSLDKAQAYADELNIPKAFGSYEDMLQSGEIDAVYNPLPNDLHAKWSIAAAEQGLAVLCEKPLAMNATEAQTMVDAFEQRGLLLAEAFMWRFHPQHATVKDLIDSGAIGKVRMMNGTFTFVLTREQDIRLSSEQGGGSLMDVGCYPINATRLLLGEEPDGGHAFAQFAPNSHVDLAVSAVLSFPSGVMATIDCGFTSSRTNAYEVRGTQGRIRVEQAFIPDGDEVTTIRVWRGENDTTYEEITIDPANQYTLMAQDFADALLNQRPFRFPVQDAIKNMLVIDNLIASAKSQEGYWE